MAMTADRLLTGVKRRVSIPASQVLMTDSDILQLADDVTKAYIVPIFLSVRQDFFVTSSLTQLVDAQASYDIPYRAVARGLRDLKVVDASGTTRDVALVAIEDEHRFSQTTTIHSFYFKGDKVVLIPAPNSPASGDSVEFWWEQPPANLCKTSDAALITGISGGTITVSSVPSTMTAGVDVDFVKSTSGNATLAYDIDISSVTATTVVVSSSDVPSTLAVGDYISLAETTPYIQLPNEAFTLLESLTGKRVAMSIGDYDAADRLDKDIDKEDKNLKLLCEPRIQGEPTIIINRSGLLRGRRFMARRGLLF